MTKKEQKEYREILKEYNSIDDHEYDEEDEEEFYDWGRDTYNDSFELNWNFGTDYEDF